MSIEFCKTLPFEFFDVQVKYAPISTKRLTDGLNKDVNILPKTKFAPVMLFAKPPCPKKCELTIKNIATMRAMSKAQLRGCFIVGAVAVES